MLIWVFLESAGEACLLPVVTPADDSLTAAEYMELGIPDPSDQWSAEEYVSGTGILGSIARTKLPRYQSSKSGLIFERLLITYSKWPDLLFDAPLNPEVQHRDDESTVSPLPDIYGVSCKDQFLFDRELVEIRSVILEGSLGRISPRSNLKEKVKELSEQLDEESSDEKRLRISELIRKYEDLMEVSSGVVRGQLSDLMDLASLSQLDGEIRQALEEKVVTLVPRAVAILSDTDRIWIAELAERLSRLEFNAAIRKGYLDSVDLLRSHDRSLSPS
jgi:hypothetical protein